MQGWLNMNNKIEMQKASELNDWLYGVVEWLNENPILDGMPYFKTKKEAILYAKHKEEIAKKYKMNLRWTIIRLKKAV